MLYVVPTPIGNRNDITLRGLEVLQKSQKFICEDPRMARKLLNLYDITGKRTFIQIIKNHQFNEQEIRSVLKSHMASSEASVTLIVDAGTPGISDPGREVIAIAQEMAVEYTVLPGANAVTPAIAASGFVAKEFTFLGFLPIKKGRKTAIEYIIRSQYPTVIYESVHRIEKLIEQLKNGLEPERKVCFCREISKQYETIWSGQIGEANLQVIGNKGEYVVVINGTN